MADLADAEQVEKEAGLSIIVTRQSLLWYLEPKMHLCHQELLEALSKKVILGSLGRFRGDAVLEYRDPQVRSSTSEHAAWAINQFGQG